ncbi:polymorphic toxin type 50 domain-containing protein [Lysobacter sp. 5GHs7-4]|uniref:polymorphic toxin type 50 domain-containing protein n=1 Tax=Lysobacter sp. 5GHs7-4 TaxID=2904253 RepID=UPI001E2A0AAD|nr:polymorphic toxin type 50 domain-containing protein [Lysobacter sp. 5GHs7-4]UHQ23526.1 polymorphic toxin type 50 domain-containing protein [Lysobacter sp. 5GHs7-4]
MKNFSLSTVGVLLCALALPAEAQNAIRPGQDYPELIKRRTDVAALDSSAFGDKTDLYTGSTEFVATDVELPGNNELAVKIGRRFAVADGRPPGLFGDWDIEIPHLHGVFARTPGANATGWQVSTQGQPNQRCSIDTSQPSTAGPPAAYGQPQNLAFQSYEFWYGNKLYIPGTGDKKLMVIGTSAQRPSDSASYKWITNDQWVLSCLPATANGVPGEAFLATSPDGTKYWFDWFAKRITRSVEKEGGQPPFTLWTRLEREEVWILPTKVRDRFGNQVTYTYDSASPSKLLSISSSDGRQISVVYDGQGRISNLNAHGRTWTYRYSTAGLLDQVTLPDASNWTISLQNVFGAYTDGARSCADMGNLVADVKSGSITHPSGATGTFSFLRRRYGRSYVPNQCMWSGSNSFHLEHKLVPIQSLSSKQISGPGIASPLNFIFEYSPTNGSFDSECQSQSCPETSATKVTNPDGTWTRYTFSNRFNRLEGKALSVERGKDSAVMESESTTYLLSSAGQPFPSTLGKLPCYICSNEEEFLRPLKSKATNREGVAYTLDTVTYDEFARPKQVVRSSTMNGGYARTDTSAYHDNLSKWVLGQLASVSTNGVVPTSAAYDPTTAAPLSFSSFGFVRQTLTYNADGTIATVKDGNNNVTILSNWKRGIPQAIQHPATPESPAGSTESALVNDNGWIDWTVDENGDKTSYQYDIMGRLSRIIYPIGDTAPWADKLFSFQQVHQEEMGMPAGHWRQMVVQGNYEKLTLFDGLWRPVLQYERDIADSNGTYRIVRNAFDHDGRKTFASYPRNPYADGNWNLNTGTWTTYDALGRTTKVEQDSELGKLTTTTAYSTGGDIVVTNPRGHQTHTRYAAWDEPTTDYPIEIIEPAGITTTIVRDAGFFLRPKTVRRSGTYASQAIQVERSYFYDVANRVCRTDEPETGSTVLGYDYNDNLLWSAAGLSGLSATHCDQTVAYNAGRTVNRSYDARNRLYQMGFPNGLGDQTWTYTKDGQPASITTYNGLNYTAAVVNRYEYNKRGMLLAEHVEEPGAYSWRLGYEYDINGNLRWQSYPTGLLLDYAPNALGQATKVVTAPGSSTTGTYASAVSYHPNGAIKQFTYGNGLVHEMWQNARQLPWTVNDGGLSGFSYTYDQNGNTTQINDNAQGANFHRYLEYDALDRLLRAGSLMFGGTNHWIDYAYDPIDNLRSVIHPGVREHTYWYNAKNQLTNVLNSGGASITALGYDLQGNVNAKNSQQYGFDYGNRLRWVAGKENYRYDGFGRRTKIAKDNGDQQWHQYGQSGQYLFNSLLKANGVQTTQEIVYLGGSPIATVDHNWPSNTIIATKYQHTDALGSPVGMTSTSGALIERTNYEPYGSAINKTVDGIGYTGHVMDGATGLTYMQQRYYDSTLGKFLSTDPARSVANTGNNFNRYKYAANNPYRFTDPDGRQEAAYGGSASMFLTPEQRRVWESGERAATTEGGGALRGAAIMDGLKQFASKPELTKENITQIATVVVLATVSRGKNSGLGLMHGPSPRIHAGQQGKHQMGHNNYQPGKSILTGDPEVLGRRAGTGQSINSIEVGRPGSKERVNFGEEIGNYVDPAGNATPTTNGIIHYGKNGIHIVPSRPDQ